MYIDSTKDLIEAMRERRYVDLDGNVAYLNYTRLGSYPVVFYFSDGSAARPSSIAANFRRILSGMRDGNRDYRVTACDVYWEGEPIEDVFTGEAIESAYGDPDE